MSFAQIAKELREESELSQMQLSKKIGISAAAIGFLELGKHEPNSQTLIAYAKYFGVSTDYLLGVEDDFGIKQTDNANALPAYSKEEQQLIEDYRALNYSGKKLVKQTVETLRATSAQTEQKKNKIS